MNYNDALIKVLENDGALRDILVPINSVNDYIKFVDSLSELRFKLVTELDGRPSTPNDCIQQFRLGEEGLIGRTKISVSDVQINLWYFDGTEIEMDFFPRDVDSQKKWDAIMGFIGHISRIFSVEIGIYHEGDHTSALCKVRG